MAMALYRIQHQLTEIGSRRNASSVSTDCHRNGVVCIHLQTSVNLYFHKLVGVTDSFGLSEPGRIAITVA